MKRKLKLLGLFIVMLFQVNSIVHAQTKDGMAYQSYLPASPDAAGLGKYGEMPVNLSSGTPDISIPIYEIREGNASIPIGLSYNAGGIKVSEEATMVGLGWSLNAGGVITRITRGIADESFNGFFRNRETVVKLINNEYDDFTKRKKLFAITRGELDSEPDLFVCNLGGTTFKFSMNIKGDFETIPASNYKISYGQESPNDTKTGMWSIIDDKGNSYSFGGKVNAPVPFYLVERLRPIEYGDKDDPTAWYINFIKPSTFNSFNSSLIKFEYVSNLQRGISIYQEAKYKPLGPLSLRFPVPRDNMSSSYNDHHTVVLQKITWSQGEVKFHTTKDRLDNTSYHKLNYIGVYTKALIQVKSCTLKYGYFNANQPGNSRRLKLQSVVLAPENAINDITGEILNPPTYEFEYNESFPLPSVNSLDQDHWGYYNGPNYNTSLIPSVKVPVPVYGMVTYSGAGKRDVNPVYTGMAQLKKITYPTGGTSEFQFECNTQANINMNDRLVNQPRDINGNFYYGGLRVKKVITTDPYHPDKKSVKVYDYNDESGVSSGKIMEWLIYAFHQPRRITFLAPCHDDNVPSMFEDCGYVVIKQNSQWNLVNSSSPIVYSKVTELTGENAELGKKVSEFIHFQPLLNNRQQGLPFAAAWAQPWKFNMHKETIEKNDNNQFLPVAETEYTYDAVRRSSNIKGYKVGIDEINQEWHFRFLECEIDPRDSALPCRNVCDGEEFLRESALNQSFVTEVETFDTDYTFMASQSSKTYSSDNNAVLSTSAQNEIDPVSLQFSSAKSTNSQGQTEEVRRKFSGNYDIGPITVSAPYPIRAIANLQNKNISGAVVEETKLTDGQVTGSLLNIYDINIPNVESNYTAQFDQPIPQRQFVFSDFRGRDIQFDSRYKPVVELTQYDNFSHPLLTKYKDGPATAVLWDYDNSLPVAEITLGNPAKDVYVKRETNRRGEEIFKGNFAYTSFEGKNFGNWTGIRSDGIKETATPMGRYAYDIKAGAVSFEFQPEGRGPLYDYYLYYWKSPDAKVTVTTNATSQVKEILFTRTDGWQLIRHTLKQGYFASLSGEGFIDELRMFTTDSRMITVAYIPGLGARCQSDNNGRLQYYSYDPFGRLSVITDMEGNIVKTLDYQFQK